MNIATFNNNEKKLNKRVNSVSARPACPVCGCGSLTGQITGYAPMFTKDGGTLRTTCQNPECCARIFMTPDWKITRAERHYWPDGSLIP